MTRQSLIILVLVVLIVVALPAGIFLLWWLTPPAVAMGWLSPPPGCRIVTERSLAEFSPMYEGPVSYTRMETSSQTPAQVMTSLAAILQANGYDCRPPTAVTAAANDFRSKYAYLLPDGAKGLKMECDCGGSEYVTVYAWAASGKTVVEMIKDVSL